MAQINMNKVKKDTGNSVEIEKSEAIKQAEINKESVELTDNTSEQTKDIKETDKQTKEPKTKDTTTKVVVKYVGGGIWRDSKGNLWASEDKSANILSERQFTMAEYEEREDIKFMVKYGSMKETYVK